MGLELCKSCGGLHYSTDPCKESQAGSRVSPLPSGSLSPSLSGTEGDQTGRLIRPFRATKPAVVADTSSEAGNAVSGLTAGNKSTASGKDRKGTANHRVRSSSGVERPDVPVEAVVAEGLEGVRFEPGVQAGTQAPPVDTTTHLGDAGEIPASASAQTSTGSVGVSAGRLHSSFQMPTGTPAKIPVEDNYSSRPDETVSPSSLVSLANSPAGAECEADRQPIPKPKRDRKDYMRVYMANKRAKMKGGKK